ncbi:MAG: 1-acyl-sn-glycerol-3-phosphate acyltransferase [Acidimicrobiales bacterium]
MRMSGSRGMTLRRRALSVGGVAVAVVALAPLLVVALPVLALVDLATGKPSLPMARLAVFGLWYLGWEVVAVAAASALWVASGFGWRIHSPRFLLAHRRLQTTWVVSLLGAARRVLRLDLQIEGAEHLSDGPLVVLCRHASLVDTLIPARLLLTQGLGVRYVLKDDLMWDPALDIIGHRLPNYFVDRSSPDPEAEALAIGRLAAGAAADEAVVIFPEGTRWSPGKRRRVIDSLHEREPERARRAERNVFTMPPRSRGTLAILAGAADADVAVVAHTGLEGLSGPKEALRALPLRHPVRVSIRRIPRAEVPEDPAGQRAWLHDQWDQVEDWVSRNTALMSDTARSVPLTVPVTFDRPTRGR